MMPFMNAFYALEDNKKRATKYFVRVEEFLHPKEN